MGFRSAVNVESIVTLCMKDTVMFAERIGPELAYLDD